MLLFLHTYTHIHTHTWRSFNNFLWLLKANYEVFFLLLLLHLLLYSFVFRGSYNHNNKKEDDRGKLKCGTSFFLFMRLCKEAQKGNYLCLKQWKKKGKKKSFHSFLDVAIVAALWHDEFSCMCANVKQISFLSLTNEKTS